MRSPIEIRMEVEATCGQRRFTVVVSDSEVTTCEALPQQYGKKYEARAASAGSKRFTSSEKNHTPGIPFFFTYVRTFTSGNEPKYGIAGVPGKEILRIEKGMRPTQAEPSNVSISSPLGSNACTTEAS